MGRMVLLLGGLLLGCAHNPPKPATPPATTQEACVQVRDFFAKQDMPFSAPANMNAGCHFQVESPRNLNRAIAKQLEASGWKGNPAGDKATPQFAWKAPATRCAFVRTELRRPVNPVHGSVGVSGGTHISPSFGVGIMVGSSVETSYDYKIDCLPK